MKELITLENLPDGIYIELSENDEKTLWTELFKMGNVKEISEQLQIPLRNLYKYKEGNSGYPVYELKKLLKITKLKVLDKVKIKTQRDSKTLAIKFPVMMDKTVSEFLGHLLGDGGIDHQLGVHYTTDEKDNIEKFDSLIQNSFGEIERKTYDYKTRVTVYYPKILGILLNRIMKIANKSKVDSDVSIPDILITNMDNEMKEVFVKAFYECDGDADYVRIVQGGRSLEQPPKILIQIRDMLKNLGYNSVIIKPTSTYQTLKGERKRWILRFLDKDERKRFKATLTEYRE